MLISVGKLGFYSFNKDDFDTGYSVMIERINMINFISKFDTIHRGLYYRKVDKYEPRRIYYDSYGFVCPINTPPSDASGLINHLSIGTIITSIKSLRNQNKLFKLNEVCLGLNSNFMTTNFFRKIEVIIDNFLLAYFNYNAYNKTYQQLHSLKKLKSIFFDERTNHTDDINSILSFSEIHINLDIIYRNKILIITNANRCMRLTQQVNCCNFEFIGIKEQNSINFNMKIKFENKNSQKHFSHRELGYENLFSFSVIVNPFFNHNLSTRNIYQCQMSKHAVSIPFENLDIRKDSKLPFLVGAQYPILNYTINSYRIFEYYPLGVNVIISIASNTGLDMEDACLINKYSGERGMFEGFFIRADQSNVTKIKEFKKYIKEALLIIYQNNQKILDLWPENTIKSYGIINKNRYMVWGFTNYNFINCMNIEKICDDKEFNNLDSCDYPAKCLFVQNIKSKKSISVICYNSFSRSLCVGDKLSPRHGQKSIISSLYNPCDLPFHMGSGVTPDMIFNPHSFPSRMTIGMIREMLIARSKISSGKVKGSCTKGLSLDRSPFWFEDSGNYLGQDFFCKNGDDPLIDGKSGLIIISKIYSGIVFYNKLIQMVKDKFQIRIEVGEVTKGTGKPIAGRKFNGAVKIGEMEKDALLVHGGSSVIRDRFHISSDYYRTLQCMHCGRLNFRMTTSGLFHLGRKQFTRSRRSWSTGILFITESNSSEISEEESESDYFLENQCCEQPIFTNALISGTTFFMIKEIMNLCLNVRIIN
mmetsp:Transcript_28522/g.50193  ORF Transcript_28522/g.50193 Transcript_28522/m.50193 type:complete len:760 (-) Transcript_28522:1576-3855(-)